MSIEITRPTEGGVTITLPFNEAEVLLRIIGLTNSGSLTEHAPNLMEVVDNLVEEFGRTDSEDARYGVRSSGNQLYIWDNENPPF